MGLTAGGARTVSKTLVTGLTRATRLVCLVVFMVIALPICIYCTLAASPGIAVVAWVAFVLVCALIGKYTRLSIGVDEYDKPAVLSALYVAFIPISPVWYRFEEYSKVLAVDYRKARRRQWVLEILLILAGFVLSFFLRYADRHIHLREPGYRLTLESSSPKTDDIVLYSGDWADTFSGLIEMLEEHSGLPVDVIESE